MFGWKTKGVVPHGRKFIMLAEPHTSNWDFVFFLLIVFKFKLPLYWMGKNTLFRRPFKGILEWLGGIPIDRSQKKNIVNQMVDAFRSAEHLVVTIAPSGTRKNVGTWKTGFYHIASQADVPIVCGFMDYKLRTGGVGPTLFPSGDIEKDITTLKQFYRTISGKYPAI